MGDGSKMMRKTYTRKVSPAERFFFVYNEKGSPFVIQAVLEGKGHFDEAVWKEAVAKACEANPGSRLLYKGRSAWAQWVDSGVPAPVRFVDGSNWSGYDANHAPFLFEMLPIRDGYTCEVLLINGGPDRPARVVFRCLHSIMDGAGVTMWMHDIFRALRNEPLVGSDSDINDSQLAAKLNFPKKRNPKPVACLTPTGLPKGDEKGIVWKRKTIQGKYSKLMAQLALAVAKEARKQGAEHVRLAIPHNLRQRVPSIKSTGNLARRIYLDIPPNATVDSVHATLTDRLNNLTSDYVFTLLIYLPLAFLKQLMIVIGRRKWRKGLFRDTGTISNLGRVQLEQLSGAGFQAQSCFYIAPEVTGKPFFIGLSGYDDKLELVTVMPKKLASHGRLDKFITNILAELKRK